jgi:AcrR family transcriptional regulator
MKQFENNKKYQAILSTSKELFWKFGVKRVSVEELCERASVSKMTFYKFFSNKVQLAKAVLKKEVDEAMLRFDDIVKSGDSFEAKLKNIFLLKLKGVRTISREFIEDVYRDPESELAKYMNELQGQSMQVIVRFYQNAQKEGSIRGDVKIDFILAYTRKITEMLQDEQLLSCYEKPGDLVMEAMAFMFYGVVKDNG